MQRSLSACAALALALTVSGGTATAKPGALLNLKGSWVGTSDSIVRGTAPHHDGSGDAPRVDHVEFTLTITGQDGRRFWGTVSGRGTSEPVIGVIGFDGRSITARDSDGLIEGTIIDANTIDSVYSHNNGTSAVVAANRWKRQK